MRVVFIGVAVRRLLAVSASVLLSACQTFSPDGGLGPVAAFTNQELGKDIVAIDSDASALTARTAIERLLKRTLTADAAVQIALLNNRGLQAAFNELRIAEAAMIGESLPPNPSFSLTRISGSAELEIERQVVASILALATLPARSEVAADRFRQAQLRAVEETLRLAAETRRAYYRAVAARQLVEFLAQAQSAAESAAQLAKRLGETGAMNKLDQAREQVFYADVTAQLAARRQRATSERERLARSMGLWGNDLGFKLPNALSALPRRPQSLPAIEADAVRRRVDLQIGRIELEALAKSYGLTNATRFINILDAGYADKITKDKTTGEKIRDRGFVVEFQVPLFDFGEVRVRQAEQTYMATVNRLAERAVNARSEARDAYRVYRSTYEVAAHFEREVLPLRTIISDETMLRYGAMQIDVFSLLAEARQRITATIAAIEAKQDFWLASTDLSVAVLGGGIARSPGDNAMPLASSEPNGPGH